MGFTIPFAFAMAALIEREAGAEWIRRTRAWTLVSWTFLSIGIVSGAKWAYVELGWGGYWAWDPVENASFIPWAVATAFLHSVMIQQSKGMLKTWNVSLIALTFFFTIFGTFLTRSGVIQSVHSFGESNLGTYFLMFMLLITVISAYLIFDRSHLLKDENAFEGLLSKESSFLFNNVLFLGLAFVTFWGTIFPIISEAVTGKKVTVGPPFFNQMNGPIFLGVIVLTGICPLIAWRRSSLPKLARHLLVPLTAGLATLLVCFLYLRQPAAAATYGSVAFVAAGMLYDLLKEMRVRKGFHPEERLPVAVWNLMRMRSRIYLRPLLAGPADLFLIMVYVPRERVMGDVQRIFYFHVPLAWTAFLAFAVTCLFGLRYLRGRRPEHDRLAQASAEIGMVFTTLVLVTGSLWTRSTWGTYWTWEPRLMTAFVLWLAYAFYLILRRHIESPERARLLSSTYGIVAFVNVPIVFMSIRWWRTVHPVLIGREGFKMETSMVVVLGFSLLTFTVLYLLVLNMRTRLARLEYRLTSLQNTLMEKAG